MNSQDCPGFNWPAQPEREAFPSEVTACRLYRGTSPSLRTEKVALAESPELPCSVAVALLATSLIGRSVAVPTRAVASEGLTSRMGCAK